MTNKTIILAALLALALTPFANAADAAGKARKGGAGAAGGRFGGGLEELNLNEDQKSKLQEFMRENGEKLRALREDQSTPREDKAKKFQEFQEAMSAKMKEVLTAEQFTKWEKSRASGPGAGGLAGGREQIQKALEELNLTPEQKEKVEAAMKEQGQAMQGLRDASPEERREKFQKLQETMTAKMKEILNKEQFEKWEKSRAALGGRLGGGDAAKKKRGNN
ncbi:MAG: hypothetical protein HZA89_03320 [Verrucomicrobia bacterium]|nr:hypothetical protein [Verrucomicrobiota bacterium]